MQRYLISFLSVLFLFGAYAFTPSYEVCGSIVDESGEALIGVSVVEKGTENGVVTDIDGQFCLTTTTERPVLMFSYTGFDSKELAVSKEETVKIVMTARGVLMDEVVVSMSRKPRRSEKRKKAKRDAAVLSITAYDMAGAPASGYVDMESSMVSTSRVDAPKIALPKSGQLTAAEWNDLHNWEDWRKLIKEE
ncbi:MAG: carboxypeptidase-like regulatory domain-containing protein, partial [Bacteroidota bacterium]